jgi:hypothetical protein
MIRPLANEEGRPCDGRPKEKERSSNLSRHHLTLREAIHPRPSAPEREARVLAIREAAQARAALGQQAIHQVLDDGRHRITLADRSSGRVRVFTGPTLPVTIAAALQQKEDRAE